jgi:hypothetical protein
MVGQLAGHLFHPGFMRTRRATGEVNSTSLQFDDKQVPRLQNEFHWRLGIAKTETIMDDVCNVKW